ncbi:uncharacterized protein LOC121249262 [Juglans microcarpa x Juglans regia]|uniref:uncharacterized protein LOC121249262 n=1 Tax=Juglans microcarpa x Juglans regia TaxID=2249226 RepID=UPI001B7E057B|nr:uncharacterized protein LOC121249262 [Juglans microcarpa x Juglans regia]
MNNVNGSSRSLTNTKSLVGNEVVNKNSGVHGGGFGGEFAFSTAASGIRAAIMNNSGTFTGRVGLSLMPQGASVNLQQQELASRLLNGLGAVNGSNNPQLNWKYP